jgi:hypothetical protein
VYRKSRLCKKSTFQRIAGLCGHTVGTVVTHTFSENSMQPSPPASISWYTHRAFASVFAFSKGVPIFCHLQEISNAMDQSENINLLHKITTITIIFKLLTSIIPLEI